MKNRKREDEGEDDVLLTQRCHHSPVKSGGRATGEQWQREIGAYRNSKVRQRRSFLDGLLLIHILTGS